jgi:hypothetical protein
MLNDAILVVSKLVWIPSWFWLTTGIIWAQVRKFERFGACFCTCALIIWSVLLHSPYLQKFQNQERERHDKGVRKDEKNTHRLAQFWSKSNSSLHGSGVWLNNIHKVSVHFSSSIHITPDKAHRGRMSKKANLLKRNALVRNQERKYEWLERIIWGVKLSILYKKSFKPKVLKHEKNKLIWIQAIPLSNCSR